MHPIVEETGNRFSEIVGRVRYKPDWTLRLALDMERWFIQWEWADRCNITGDSTISRSAKYHLSHHMTDTEIVNRAFLAALKAEEHELREKFLYRPTEESGWRAPYNTHIDIGMLWGIATELDIR